MSAPKHSASNTAFGYFGSKKRLAVDLCSQLPPHHAWVEVFCGSAALTLAKRPAPIEIINDLDNEIINFFEQLRNNEKELLRLVALTPYSREELRISRLAQPNVTSLERARRFLVSSMMAINGVFGSRQGGFSYSDSYSRDNRDARVNRWYHLPERLTEVVERLRSVRVENKDAKKLFLQYVDRPNTLVYLDPPYLADRTNGYNVDANDPKFHEELLVTANAAKCMVFISGYESELYNSFLTEKKGWTARKIDTTTRDASGKIHKRTEVIWMNRIFLESRENNRLPLKLTETEQKQKKLNPSWPRKPSS